MEIYLGRRAVRQIRDAAREAIEDGDTEALREEITDAFSDEDVRVVESQLASEELYEFITAMLDDWSGDDVDEVFELMESQFAEIGIDLSTEYSDLEDDEVMEDEDELPPIDELDEEP